MNLTIGLLKQDAGWELLLTQIGAAWGVYDASQTMSPDSFAVMIVNAAPTTMQHRDLAAYLASGGSILTDNGAARLFLDCTYSKKHFTSIAPNDCAPFSPASILDIDSTGTVITKSGGYRVDGGTSVQIIANGAGTVVSLPYAVSPLILSTASRRKNFYAPPDRLPSERVAAVSKGSIRQLVTNILELLHHRRALPFVHTWYYPDGHPTIFTFRVDTDKGSETELRELYDVCARHGVPGTWFVDVQSHERWLDFFSSFSGQEIGLHCYTHETSAVRKNVLANFGTGLHLLREAGFTVNGASAPCGTWNAAVGSVYNELEMAYSSEFSLDYDDLPFFPVTAGGPSSVMQLPIHPICVGSMKRSRYTSLQMRDYFRTCAMNRIVSREPMCFYHHPTHHHLEVFDEIFSLINELKIPMLSYSAYAAWWKKRIAVRPQFTLDNGSITIPARASGDVWYRIALPGNEEIITKIDGRLTITEARRVHRHGTAAIPEDILRARKFDPRHPLINMLDYWYKTTQ